MVIIKIADRRCTQVYSRYRVMRFTKLRARSIPTHTSKQRVPVASQVQPYVTGFAEPKSDLTSGPGSVIILVARRSNGCRMLA